MPNLEFTKVSVRTIQINAKCTQEKCDGFLLEDKDVIGTLACYPPRYRHVCNKCGHIELLLEKFPKLEFEEICENAEN